MQPRVYVSLPEAVPCCHRRASAAVLLALGSQRQPHILHTMPMQRRRPSTPAALLLLALALAGCAGLATPQGIPCNPNAKPVESCPSDGVHPPQPCPHCGEKTCYCPAPPPPGPPTIPCNPKATPPETCPDGKPCPQCGSTLCHCPATPPPPPPPPPPPGPAPAPVHDTRPNIVFILVDVRPCLLALLCQQQRHIHSWTLR